MKKYLCVFLSIVIICSCNRKPKETKSLTLPPVFSDHMVVQRNQPIQIWGWGEPGKQVSVEFHESAADAIVNQDGSWFLELSPEKAGGPYELKISSGETVVFSDVLVGDVWLLSGQSNMAFNLERTDNGEKAIENANNQNIRLLRVNNDFSFQPQTDHINTSWHVCTPDSAALFSAVGYYFGSELQKNIEVPLGLIHCAFGGSTVEAWICSDSLRQYKAFKSLVNLIDENTKGKTIEIDDEYIAGMYEKQVAAWEDSMAAILEREMELDLEWIDKSAQTWQNMPVPGFWEGQGLENLDGIVWFRKTVNIPEAWQGKELILKLGAIDDIDVTYVNGQKVGMSFVYNEKRVYRVPAEMANSGSCAIDVKVVDVAGGGGFAGNEDYMQLMCEGDSVSLAGKWKYHLLVDELSYPERPRKSVQQNIPTGLYNKMLYPLIPFGLKGAAWYQGESNNDRPKQYNQLIKTMIRNWRAAFKNEDLPFIIIQLPVWRQRTMNPSESDWAELREAQFNASQLHNVEVVCNIDLGDADDIHPTLKLPVGERTCLVALNMVYGMDTIFSGPRKKDVTFENGKAIISFSHVDGGLVKKGSYDLKGFAIAGNDKKFIWADAVIDNDKVEVSSPKVLNPVAVRYAWGDNPECNLYNAAGLPAFPFRTDNWKGVKVKTVPPINQVLISLFSE